MAKADSKVKTNKPSPKKKARVRWTDKKDLSNVYSRVGKNLVAHEESEPEEIKKIRNRSQHRFYCKAACGERPPRLGKRPGYRRDKDNGEDETTLEGKKRR